MKNNGFNRNISIIGFITICSLLIMNILVMHKCTSSYNRYNKYYKDTVYVDMHEDHNAFRLKGTSSGIIQSGFGTNHGEHLYIVIRRFDNSKLDTIEVGTYDYDEIEIGDTIYNEYCIPHDTIYTHDTVHIENTDKKHKSFIIHGSVNGIVVDGHHNVHVDSNKNKVKNDSYDIVIRPFGNVNLKTIAVGLYDFQRINLGDTIYKQ